MRSCIFSNNSEESLWLGKTFLFKIKAVFFLWRKKKNLPNLDLTNSVTFSSKKGGRGVYETSMSLLLLSICFPSNLMTTHLARQCLSNFSSGNLCSNETVYTDLINKMSQPDGWRPEVGNRSKVHLWWFLPFPPQYWGISKKTISIKPPTILLTGFD